jgi:hypothetical protein
MGDQDRRVSLNLRIDPDKYAMLEKLRKTGFGLGETERNRSDIYNEILGYGLQTQMLKMELGDREFEKLWKMIHKINLKRLNLEKIEQMVQ